MTANLSRMLAGNAARFAEADALVFEARRWTHAELDFDVNALAAALVDLSVGDGDRIGVVADNVPEFLLLGLAAAKVGAVLVPLNYRLTSGELTHLLRHAAVCAVATVPEYVELTEAALVEADPDVSRIALEPIRDYDDWTPVADLVACHVGSHVPDAEVADDTLQRVVYTSGTTSLPKGVMLSHGNVNANMHAQIVDLGLTSADRVLTVAPLYHVGGTDLPGYGVWHAGGRMVVQRRFDPGAVLDAIVAEQITGMVAAATMLDMIRREADARGPGRADLSSVRWLIFSQVTPALFAVARDLFPHARLIEGYGLTETCSGLTYLDAAHMESKQGSVGIALPWVDVRVVDPSGHDVSVDEDGEVVARGPKVSAGYLDDPVATAEAFRDGWFHTGDIGRVDSDGYLYIRDRIKDMIRSGGENMASAEIENVLADHPDVLAVSVVGAPHPVWQEVPVAFVVGRPSLDPESLVALARGRLSKFKVPKEVYLVEDLPTNPSGKVLKRDLRELAPTLVPTWSYEAEA